MHTPASQPSHLDLVRRHNEGHNPLSNSDIFGRVISFLPYSSLPPLRRVCRLWHTIIDITIAAGIGPVVLDATGNSQIVTEFWIRHGRGDEWASRRPSSLPSRSCISLLPRLLAHVLDHGQFGPGQPTTTTKIDLALLQLVRDRPQVALSFSCERIWRAFECVHIPEIRNRLKFAAVFGPSTSILATRRKFVTYFDTGAFDPELAAELTYCDVRMLALLDFILTDRHRFMRRLFNLGLLQLTPIMTELMINIATVAALDSDMTGHNVLAQLRFLINLWRQHPRSCNYARSLLPRLDGIVEPEILAAARAALGPLH